MIEFCRDLSEFVVEVTKIPVFSFMFNMLFSFLGAFIFFQLPTADIASSIRHLKFLDDLRKENLKKYYYIYALRYCFAASLFASITVQHQFGKFSYFYSFVYGVAGPFALRKQISEKLLEGPIDKFFGESLNSSEKGIDQYSDTKKQVEDKLELLSAAIKSEEKPR